MKDNPRSPVIYRMPWSQTHDLDPELLIDREWLVTNGLGGYASGTISGISTRRYHGLLVAALPAPLGRMMMFNHLVERVRIEDRTTLLSGETQATLDEARAVAGNLVGFSLEFGLPVWQYCVDGCLIEKRLWMPHRANTIHLTYRLLEGSRQISLHLRPGLHYRAHEAPVGEPDVSTYVVRSTEDRIEIAAKDLTLKLLMRHHEGALVLGGSRVYEVEYRLEERRGYPHRDKLWSPGKFVIDLSPGESVVLTASTEPWDTLTAVDPLDSLDTEFERRAALITQADQRARDGFAAELVLAADQFIIDPCTRLADEARARAAGVEARSVIAGYHWFTDWGRDTMISLEGLTLSTGRASEAGYILRTFGMHVRDGLIPNLFPEGEQSGLYHTADATLWYFHALERYLAVTGDRATFDALLPRLREVIAKHLSGTKFGIGVDPADGLLRQGAEGYQLTWMDAKVGDWVVTPRRGKAVEINALWYNALRTMEGWLRNIDPAGAAEMAEHADRACHSFNARFWCEDRGWLYDVIDGEGPDDASLRPNQVFAISLPHPVLAENRWPAVMDVVRNRLLTPVGLRSLGQDEPDYKQKYSGDLRSRDAAYHQGTVWAWLIGPFIDAWLKVHPGDRSSARQFLEGFIPHLSAGCLGTISEIFDAEPPYKPRGCISQAWSVAEVLRCWIKTTPGD